MFWDKGYTPSQNIEALLEKENSTVEEFLDDDDILQECKTLKKSIVKYFTRPDVIRRLVEIITTEPSEDLPFAQRFRHANMACEILTLGLPSLDEKILSDEDTLKILYSYLENEPPLNPLLSSFFNKTFCMLFTKKLEQDWFLYQQMCLQLLEYLKSRKNFLDLIFRHFATPVIPELILQLMKDVEGGQLKRNLYEWLTEEKLVERLIAILGNPDECDKHSNVTEFLCDLIKQGRTMRQTEHENDSFEPAFDGSNPILKTIESEASIEALLNVILEPNAQESAIVSGISVVLTLIKPNAFVDEHYSDRSKFIQNREKEIHEQIATTVIRVMAPRLNELNQLLKTPPIMPPINTTAARLEPPFGMTRLQVCRVFTVLLQTKNEEISDAICKTDFFETLLDLFKQYCWNNFLHSELEKCMQIIFETSSTNNNNNSGQGSTIVNDGSVSKSSNNGDSNGTSASFMDCMIMNGALGIEISGSETNVGDSDGNGDADKDSEISKDVAFENPENNALNLNDTEENKIEIETETSESASAIESSSPEKPEEDKEEPKEVDAEIHEVKDEVEEKEPMTAEIKSESTEEHGTEEGGNEENSFKEKDTKNPTDTGPSALQKHLITNCKLITKLIECWEFNREVESAEKGRRLGYMGHLIKTLRHITNCISESEHIGALIESSLSNETETEKWQSITNTKDGDLTKALATQNRLLANCNAHEACDFGHHLPKDFLSDNSTWDYIMTSNVLNNLGGFSDSNFIEANPDSAPEITDGQGSQPFKMFQFDNNFEPDDDDDEDEFAGAVGGIGIGVTANSDNNLSLFEKSTKASTTLKTLGVGNGMCSNPWYDVDPFANFKTNAATSGTAESAAAAAAAAATTTTTTTATTAVPWATDFNSDNFADFDSHFSSFASDLGESLTAGPKTTMTDFDVAKDILMSSDTDTDIDAVAIVSSEASRASARQEYDNNANVEKLPLSFDDLALKNDANKIDDKLEDDIVPQSLVRTLQSVMQESEDDYEDDEGMWTKPLGQSANDALNLDEAITDVNTDDKIAKSSSILVNGTLQENSDNQWPSHNDDGSVAEESTDVDKQKSLQEIKSVKAKVETKEFVDSTS